MLTLSFNEFDEQWHILDGITPISNGDTIEDAIEGARVLTTDPIYQLNDDLEYVEVIL